jgi:hypothetical protein
MARGWRCSRLSFSLRFGSATPTDSPRKRRYRYILRNSSNRRPVATPISIQMIFAQSVPLSH